MSGHLDQEEGNIEKRYYDAASLGRVLSFLEEAHGISSADFYAAYLAGESLDMPRFHQHVWASFYRDVLRLGGDDFTDNAKRVLAVA